MEPCGRKLGHWEHVAEEDISIPILLSAIPPSHNALCKGTWPSNSGLTLLNCKPNKLFLLKVCLRHFVTTK